MWRKSFLCFLSFLLVAPSAFGAETVDAARVALADTLGALKATGKRQKELEEKTGALSHEMHHLQEEMVSLARDAQGREDELADYEDKLSILEHEKAVKSEALNAHERELSATLGAIIKLRELPPEAVIAMPGRLDETLSTARALTLINHAVAQESESLRGQLRELDALEAKIRHNREAISTREDTLLTRQAELKTKISERSRIQAALDDKARAEKEHLARLTVKSKNLQDLLDSLQKSETATRAQEARAPRMTAKNERKTPHRAMRPFPVANGNLPLPAGRIVSRFGNAGTAGALSKGIVLETRVGAGVVAPFDGEVVFAGNFRDYGRMVILRHNGEYHSLLSGLDQINCSPGQFLLEGEPLGTMGSGTEGRKLYLELRRDGHPVNPLPWFKG